MTFVLHLKTICCWGTQGNILPLYPSQ